MEKKDKAFLKQLIENTKAHRLEQVGYKIESNSEGEVHATLWSLNTETGSFHDTSLIPVLESYFSVYVAWNRKYNRCELNVF